MQGSEKPPRIRRCNSLSNTDAQADRLRRSATARWSEGASLYGASGDGRKYLNRAEREIVLRAVAELKSEKALFALTLAWTGARVSEVLALTPSSFQVDSAIVAITTLKRRRHIVREVPLPPEVMAALDRHFGISAAQALPDASGQRLWPMCRVTAYRFIRKVAHSAGIVGQRGTPRGFRHAFGVGVLQAGVPLNLAQRWLGHSRISSTAIYLDACGPEEVAFAERFWRSANGSADRSSWTPRAKRASTQEVLR